MASIIPGYNYDIFISYRQKDNKGDRWVSEFVDSLKTELEATFKEDISVYFDENPHDRLQETHNVDKSLEGKLKCLIFIPILSQTYCDPKSYAWQYEFLPFLRMAEDDQFGRDVKLRSGNVASRILPIRIHDLEEEDIQLFEKETGSVLRALDFVFKTSSGVSRPLLFNEDHPHDNLNETYYRDQINKVALAIKDIIGSMKIPVATGEVKEKEIQPDIAEQPERDIKPRIKKHNLPISTTSFIGREKEIKEVRDLFNKSRLITITGAGGCGKTRLAREIASMLIEEYIDGVWFIDLAPIKDPILVSKEISEVLNIKEDPNKPIVNTLIESIKDKSLLILLDNCEHLIQECAEIAHKLLNTVKGIRILATSREALNIQGEVVWRIPLLSFPITDSIKDIKEINQFEAIRLFVDRAGSNQPGFTLNPQNVSSVTQICRRIDGIPLAIELAASRIRHLGPKAILERLEEQFKLLSSSSRTGPERQQTLKATIDWSYKLLSKQEQLLFKRLSVFVGNFNLEAIEEVCSDKKLKKDNIIEVISQLVDKSLVISENLEDESVRYKCLVPIQQYSLQKLIECGDEKEQREQHLSYYLNMAEDAYKEQFESQLKWLNKLEVEHKNLLSALNWSDYHSPEEFIVLSGALAWFWRGHSHIILGKDYLEKASSKVVGKSEEYARVLFGLAIILGLTQDVARVMDLMNESLGIWRKSKNLREEAWVLSEISEPYFRNGDYETSLKYCEQSLEIARKVDNPGLINHCLIYLCQVFVHSKQYDHGRPLVEELLASSEKLEYIFGIESARHYLGDCALGTKNFKEAENRYALGIETALKYGMIALAAFDLQGVAFALSGQLRLAKSIRLDAAARELMRNLGGTVDGLYKFWDDWIDTYIGGAREILGEELTRKYEDEGKNMGFEASVEYAMNFDKD